MPLSISIKDPHSAARRCVLGALVAAVGALSLFASRAEAAELLMLEQPGCVWCKAFNEEIAPAYAKSDEGQLAPLRRVDITEEWPSDLQDIRKERLTPTFVLMHDGVEIDRLRGYPGDAFFWPLLDEMMAKLPPSAGLEPRASGRVSG